LKIYLDLDKTSAQLQRMNSTNKTKDEQISALCAQCDSASSAASSSLEQIAAATSARKRASWKREHAVRLLKLENASLTLALALCMQPHAADELTPSMRQHAEHIHTYAIRSLKNFRA
jgi:hypothetical protein